MSAFGSKDPSLLLSNVDTNAIADNTRLTPEQVTTGIKAIAPLISRAFKHSSEVWLAQRYQSPGNPSAISKTLRKSYSPDENLALKTKNSMSMILCTAAGTLPRLQKILGQ
jgi:hypothetical protein